MKRKEAKGREKKRKEEKRREKKEKRREKKMVIDHRSIEAIKGRAIDSCQKVRVRFLQKHIRTSVKDCSDTSWVRLLSQKSKTLTKSHLSGKTVRNESNGYNCNIRDTLASIHTYADSMELLTQELLIFFNSPSKVPGLWSANYTPSSAVH